MIVFGVIGLFIVLMTISEAPRLLEGVQLTGYDYAAGVSVVSIFVLAWLVPSTQTGSMIATYTWVAILTVAWFAAYLTAAE